MLAPAVLEGALTGFPGNAVRQRHLGQLESDVATVGDDLAPILISFSRRLVSDDGSSLFGDSVLIAEPEPRA